MKEHSIFRYLFLPILLFLVSCGGGSTVTAVSLTADPAQVDVSGRSIITAKSTASVAGSTLGEKVSFSIRSNETGSELDVVSDRLDANGEAKANYRAGTRQGVDIVEASFGSGARATVTITVGGGVVVGGISLEKYGSAPLYTIRAVIRDTRGALVPGVTVNFSTSKGTLSITSGVTNTNGFAETILTLPAQESARVYAHAGGQSASIYIGSQ